MKLSEPKVITFLIAALVALVGVILNLAAIGGVLGFWLVVVGFVILALGNLLKGL